MRALPLALGISVLTAPLAAQPTVELLYGLDRNVRSTAEVDGWMGVGIEWPLRAGLALGLGTDHHFEDRVPRAAEHEGWAVFASLTRSFVAGPLEPFVRAGVGLGGAPCEGDTCRDGLHLRGSLGVRGPLVGRLRWVAELGLSRVSRPFGGLGLAWRGGESP